MENLLAPLKFSKDCAALSEFRNNNNKSLLLHFNPRCDSAVSESDIPARYGYDQNTTPVFGLIMKSSFNSEQSSVGLFDP